MTATLEDEVWRVSPSLPEYEVSSLGRVRRIPYTKRMPKGGTRTYGGQAHHGQDTPEGRMIFVFRGKTYKVHRLVCEAFNGPEPFPRAVVMHLDEDYRNNRASNVSWGTQRENLNMPKVKAYHRSRTGPWNPAHGDALW